jgi:hypothetical protein
MSMGSPATLNAPEPESVEFPPADVSFAFLTDLSVVVVLVVVTLLIVPTAAANDAVGIAEEFVTEVIAAAVASRWRI